MVNHPNRSIRSRAVQYAMGRILHSTDWQDVQNDLSNHTEFGPWLDHDNGMADAQSIIRDAENRLGNKIPEGYSQ